MRRLNRGTGREPNERGAISVLVALLMVVLLGFAALAVDVGMLYSEKAQLQNGADAAALGIAQDCSLDSTIALCQPASATAKSLAKDFADRNSLDNLSNIRSVDLNPESGTVTVQTGALEAGQTPDRMSLVFANVLGISSAEVGAEASARWGGPSKAKSPFAIAFSRCEVDSSRTTDGALQFLMSHGIGDMKDSCHSTSSGHEIPGGFGWLAQGTSGTCQATVALSSPWASSDTGSDLKAGCASRLNEWQAKLSSGEKLIQLFPVFDDTSGTGSSGKLRIEAFAAVEVRGWNFNGHTFMLPDAQAHFNAGKYQNSDRGFIGRFVRYVALEDGIEFGGPTVYGATAVALTK